MTDAPLTHGYRVVVEPSRSIFGGRGQWKFSIRRIENGEPIDPRDTYTNKADLIEQLERLLAKPKDYGDGLTLLSVPVELVVVNRRGEVVERRRLR